MVSNTRKQKLNVFDVQVNDNGPALAWMTFPRLGRLVVFDTRIGDKLTVKYVQRTRRRSTYYIEIFYSYSSEQNTSLYLTKCAVNRSVAPTEKAK